MTGSGILKKILGGTALAWTLWSAPASAGRGIVIDEPPLLDVPICPLGSQVCDGFTLGVGARYATAYVYAQGVISFDQRLPMDASVAGGAASLASGTWFAPGLADISYQARALYSETANGTGVLINFYEPGVEIIPTIDDDDPGGPQAGTVPVFQFQLFPTGPGYSSMTVAFGYGLGPADGALIGYSAQGGTDSVINRNGLKVGADPDDTDFVIDLGGYAPDGSLPVPGKFALQYDDAVPEPGTWAMMMAGLGLTASALRRRSRKPPLAMDCRT